MHAQFSNRVTGHFAPSLRYVHVQEFMCICMYELVNVEVRMWTLECFDLPIHVALQ